MSLGTGAFRVGRRTQHFRPRQRGNHGNPVSGNHPCRQLPTGTVTLKLDEWENTPLTSHTYEKGVKLLTGRLCWELDIIIIIDLQLSA